MIGNITSGRGIRGLLNYILQKEGAYHTGGTMAGQDARDLAAEFKLTRQLRPNVAEPVKHYSLALPPGEHLTDDQWREVSERYMAAMGYTEAQWVAYRHQDTEHEHVHIAASRVRLDGSLVRTNNDRYKSQDIIRGIERVFGLTLVPSSNEIPHEVKGPTKGERMREKRTGNAQPVSIKAELQAKISEAVKDCPTMSVLVERLEAEGIRMVPNLQSTGRVSGLTYMIRDEVMKASDLGEAFKFSGLQKAGVEYNPERDQEALRRGLGAKEEGVGPKPAAPEEGEKPKEDKGNKKEAWAASKAAWDDAKEKKEALQKAKDQAKTAQSALWEELKVEQAARRIAYTERGQMARLTSGPIRQLILLAMNTKIRAMNERIEATKMKMAVARAEATSERMVLMEARYKAQLKAIDATFAAKGKANTPEHKKALETAAVNFLRGVKGYTESLRKGVEGRQKKAKDRDPGLYIFGAAQWAERFSGARLVVHQAAKATWLAMRNQVNQVVRVHREASAAEAFPNPTTWGRFREAWRTSFGRLKADLQAAKAAVTELHRETSERVRSLDERTRPAVLLAQAESTVKAETGGVLPPTDPVGRIMRDLQGSVELATMRSDTMSDFVRELREQGVEVEARYAKSLFGRPKLEGVSFYLGDTRVKDTDLAPNCHWKDLNQVLSFDPNRDLKALDLEAFRQKNRDVYGKIPVKTWREYADFAPQPAPNRRRDQPASQFGTGHGEQPGPGLLGAAGDLVRPEGNGPLRPAAQPADRRSWSPGSGSKTGQGHGTGAGGVFPSPGSARPGDGEHVRRPHDDRNGLSRSGSGAAGRGDRETDALCSGPSAGAGRVLPSHHRDGEGRGPGGHGSVHQPGTGRGPEVGSSRPGGEPGLPPSHSRGSESGVERLIELGSGQGLKPMVKSFMAQEGSKVRLAPAQPEDLVRAVETLGERYRLAMPLDDRENLYRMVELTLRRAYNLPSQSSDLQLDRPWVERAEDLRADANRMLGRPEPNRETGWEDLISKSIRFVPEAKMDQPSPRNSPGLSPQKGEDPDFDEGHSRRR